METEYIAVGAAVVVIVAGFVLAEQTIAPPGNGDQEQPVGAPGTTHLHAQLFVSINGSTEALNGSYLERSPRVHLHGADNILHVHATNVDLGYALRTLRIGINQSCIRFGLENQTVCDSAQVGVTVNGESMRIGAALDRVIEQGDSIVLWTGETRPDGFDQELPPEYREPVPGRSV